MNHFELVESIFDKPFLHYYKEVIYNNLSKNDIKKLNKIMLGSCKMSDITTIMKLGLSRDKRVILYNISKSKLYVKNNYPCFIIGEDIHYKFGGTKGIQISECELFPESNTFLKNVFFIGDNLVHMNFVDGELAITTGILDASVHYNESVSNGKDWIKHYLGRKDIGYLYIIKFEKYGSIGFKVGITKNIDTRLKSLRKHINILDYTTINDYMLKVSIIEKAIHVLNLPQRMNMREGFEGSNECYYTLNTDHDINDISVCLGILNGNYTLSENLLRTAIKELDNE